jgi:hypothetical protein
MSQFRLENFTDFLKVLLDLNPSKATALILRDDYQEQIDAADRDIGH